MARDDDDPLSGVVNLGILNVKYSPNLGDGIIAECLENELRATALNWHLSPLDVGGRSNYGHGGSIVGSRFRLMDIVQKLPLRARQFAVYRIAQWAIERRYRQHWAKLLNRCDALVIGGGQLFTDVDLYFPLRLATAVRAAPRGIPLFVYAVGVSKAWSDRALQLFRATLRHGRLVGACVRDELSQDHWLNHFGGPAPAIVHDPGLLASAWFGPKPESGIDRMALGGRKIGLGLANPFILKQHAEKSSDVAGDSIEYYERLALELLERGDDVVLFTNGTGEDQAFLVAVWRRVVAHERLRSQVTVVDRPSCPADLVETIKHLDGVIAHRMHANIVAYSYGVPHVGLGWNRKLQSFFASVDRAAFAASSDVMPNAVVAMLDRALTAGIDPAVHARILAETRRGIGELARGLAGVHNEAARPAALQAQSSSSSPTSTKCSG